MVETQDEIDQAFDAMTRLQDLTGTQYIDWVESEAARETPCHLAEAALVRYCAIMISTFISSRRMQADQLPDGQSIPLKGEVDITLASFGPMLEWFLHSFEEKLRTPTAGGDPSVIH